MITKQNLRAYKDFQGDVDAYTRAVTGGEPERMTDAEWSEIGNLLQEVAVMLSGRASLGYKERVRRKLKDSTAEPETEQELVGIVKDSRT